MFVSLSFSSVCLFACLFISLFVCSFVHLFVGPAPGAETVSKVRFAGKQANSLFVCLFVCFVCLFVCFLLFALLVASLCELAESAFEGLPLFGCLFVCFVCEVKFCLSLFVCLFVCLFVYLAGCVSGCLVVCLVGFLNLVVCANLNTKVSRNTKHETRNTASSGERPL